MRVSMLGSVRVGGGNGHVSPRDRVVLTALAVRNAQVVSGEQLADALWGDEVPASWNKVVQGCVMRLRKALGPGTIATEANGYRLTLPASELDVARFEQVIGRARELLDLDEPDRAHVAVEEALALWRGHPFADAEGWEPARVEGERLAELRMDAEELRLEAALRAGKHGEVLAAARAAVEAAPIRERRWELLALAQYRAGRQGDALRTLQRARTVLAEELGIGPGPQLQALERSVLEQDPTLGAPESLPDPSATCPWPGLVAYGIGDAEQYFGREVEVESCLARLETDGAVVVVGPSGSGKSSLVRAGVAARLRADGRRVVVVVPGDRPLDSLSALAGPRAAAGEDVVLVVDQCEEVVTLCQDPVARAAFLDALVDHARRARLLVSLRADRLGELSTHDGFASLLERALLLLRPMDDAAVHQAIEGPARRAALLLEPGLVDLVARDVRAEAGALPLMSHALHQTWARREGRTLTVEAYRDTGGIGGAVAVSAEQVYAAADVDERAKLRELLLRLVAPVDGGDPARVRLPRSVVAGNGGYEHLVERLVAARLLTSDESTVELAHEAVARAWPRLREWLDDDVEGMRVFRHLTATATGWDALGRPASELYRGARLEQARAWRERRNAELAPVERDFLDASVAAEDDALHDAQAQVLRERRSVRKLRRLVAGVGVLAVLAVVASGVALVQRSRAEDRALVAEARRVAAEALVAEPLDRALLLAVEAVRLWDSPETRGNLLTTIERAPRLVGVTSSQGPRLFALEIGPTGATAAALDNRGGAAVYDLADRSQRQVLQVDGISFLSTAFSPGADELALAWQDNSCAFQQRCSDHGVDLVDAHDLTATTARYEGFDAPVVEVAFSPDGGLLAGATWLLGGPPENVAVWRTDAPEAPAQLLSLPDPGIDLRATPDVGEPVWVTFAPDGASLYASGAGPVAAFDLGSGNIVGTFGGLGGLALSPDGQTLAVRADDGAVELLDTATGASRHALVGHDAVVNAAAFSADGRQIATASSDETVAVWDVATGQRLHVLAGHAGAVLGVGFTGPAALHSIAGDRAIFEWAFDEASGLARTITEPSLDTLEETVVLIDPTARTILVGAGHSPVLVDVATGRLTELGPLEPLSVAWSAFSPDGDRLVTVGFDGATDLWDVGDGTRLAEADGRGHGNFGAVAFAPESGRVLVADTDGTVVELDGQTLASTGRSVDVGVAAAGVRAAPGGVFAVTRIDVDPNDGTLVVLGDLDEPGSTREVRVDVEMPRANFSPDGAHYALGGFDGRLRVLDVATGKALGPADAVSAGPIQWVEFSPSSDTLAVLGFDGVLSLADAATGAVRARGRPGPASLLGSVRFAPDGGHVLLGYRDGRAIAYETDPAAWLVHACAVAGRELTAEEWADTFGDAPPRATCGEPPTTG